VRSTLHLRPSCVFHKLHLPTVSYLTYETQVLDRTLRSHTTLSDLRNLFSIMHHVSRRKLHNNVSQHVLPDPWEEVCDPRVDARVAWLGTTVAE